MTGKNILKLTPEQSAKLFEASGVYLRRLGVSMGNAVAFPIDCCCRRCLLADDLPAVHISEDGLCNFCHEFDSEELMQAYNPEYLREVVRTYTGKDKPDCVVAFSGGKDSALALYLTIKDYGLSPVAVLVDNGFIPQEVIDAAEQYCGSLDVNLIVKKIDIRPAANVALKDPTKVIPCRSCISQVFSRIAEVCEEVGTRLVVGGHRFPPLTCSVADYTNNQRHNNIACVSPMLAKRLTESEQIHLLKEIGWRPCEIQGNTSNCKLIGVVEQVYFDSWGYNPHLYEVSKEIRAGFYDRNEGFKKIDRPHLDARHMQWVKLRLEPSLQV